MSEYKGWSKTACKKSLRQLRDGLGRLPYQTDLAGQPGPSVRSVLNHWENWNDALLDIFGQVNSADPVDVPIPDDLRASTVKIYKRGYRARLEGVSRDANPYERGWAPNVWERGWDAAAERYGGLATG